MADKPKTPNLYHSALRKLGPVKVTIKTDVQKSTFPGKPEYCVLEINGQEHFYSTENPRCADALRGRKGQTVTIVADEQKEAATIKVMDTGATIAQPPARQPEPASHTEYNADGTVALDYQAETAKQVTQKIDAERAKEDLQKAYAIVTRCNNLARITLRAVDALAAERKDDGHPMTPDEKAGWTGKIYIEACKLGAIHLLPDHPMEMLKRKVEK